MEYESFRAVLEGLGGKRVRGGGGGEEFHIKHVCTFALLS